MNDRPVILIADDNERLRTTLSDILLAKKYKVVEAQNGREALEKAKSANPDVILLDIDMPILDGIKVLKILKEDDEEKNIPIVVLTGEDDLDVRVKALRLGADDFLIKPPHIAELTARVRSLTKVKAYYDHMRRYQTILEEEVEKRTQDILEANKQMKDASLETVFRLSRAAEYKDEDTGMHLQRMSKYSYAIAKKLGLRDSVCEVLYYSSVMHDIGKIGIPDHILLKPGKLSPDEWTIMKRHTVFGGQILANPKSEYIRMGELIAVTHHEKWDGTGYPRGLKAEEIPIEGRITAVADVFDALTAKRPYKEPFSNEKSFSIIKEESGSHFDPRAVDAFFAVQEEILTIQSRYKDEGESLLFKLAGSPAKNPE